MHLFLTFLLFNVILPRIHLPFTLLLSYLLLRNHLLPTSPSTRPVLSSVPLTPLCPFPSFSLPLFLLFHFIIFCLYHIHRFPHPLPLPPLLNTTSSYPPFHSSSSSHRCSGPSRCARISRSTHASPLCHQREPLSRMNRWWRG